MQEGFYRLSTQNYSISLHQIISSDHVNLDDTIIKIHHFTNRVWGLGSSNPPFFTRHEILIKIFDMINNIKMLHSSLVEMNWNINV